MVLLLFTYFGPKNPQALIVIESLFFNNDNGYCQKYGIPYQFEDQDKEIVKLPDELLKILTTKIIKPKSIN